MMIRKRMPAVSRPGEPLPPPVDFPSWRSWVRAGCPEFDCTIGDEVLGPGDGDDLPEEGPPPPPFLERSADWFQCP
jgi:hypothetical protein